MDAASGPDSDWVKHNTRLAPRSLILCLLCHIHRPQPTCSPRRAFDESRLQVIASSSLHVCHSSYCTNTTRESSIRGAAVCPCRRGCTGNKLRTYTGLEQLELVDNRCLHNFPSLRGTFRFSHSTFLIVSPPLHLQVRKMEQRRICG
jgi:hypothetical protein